MTPNRLTDDQIAAIQARVEAASDALVASGACVYAVANDGHWAVATLDKNRSEWRENAEMFAHAPDDLTRLLADLAAARSARDMWMATATAQEEEYDEAIERAEKAEALLQTVVERLNIRPCPGCSDVHEGSILISHTPGCPWQVVLDAEALLAEVGNE